MLFLWYKHIPPSLLDSTHNAKPSTQKHCEQKSLIVLQSYFIAALLLSIAIIWLILFLCNYLEKNVPFRLKIGK